MRSAAYLRVSTEEQKDRQTIQSQRLAILEYAEKNGIEITREYVDDGVSGTIPFDERPGGSELLKDAPSNVIVYAMDRLGRDTLVTISALSAFDASDISYHSTKENLQDRLITEIKAAVAADERRKIRERSMLGMRRKAKEGGWLGGPVPYGYRIDESDGEAGDAGLRPCESEVVDSVTEADVVRRIFKLAASGESCPQIARHLNALGATPDIRPVDGSMRGIRTKRTAKSWGSGKVNRILNATIYKGEHTFNAGDEEIKREFPPLVSRATWDAAQETMAGNKMLGSGNAKREYLLKGKVVCEACEYSYIGQTFTDNRGKERVYYRISHRSPDDCSHRQIRGLEFEEYIWRNLRTILGDPEQVLEELSNHLGLSVESRSGLQEEISEYRRRLKEKEGERSNLARVARKGLLPDDLVQEQLQELNDEREVLQRYLDDLESRVEDREEGANKLRAVQEILVKYQEGLNDDPRTQQAVISELLDRIEVRTWEDENGEKRQRFNVFYTLDAPLQNATVYTWRVKQVVGH